MAHQKLFYMVPAQRGLHWNEAMMGIISKISGCFGRGASKRMYKPCFVIEAQIKLYLKKYNIFEKPLEINGMIRYTEKAVT